MNLVLLEERDIAPGGRRAKLCGRRFEHIRSVHRVRHGQTLRVGLLQGQIGQGVITGIGDEWVEMEIVLHDDPPPPLPLILILALPRPKALRRLIEDIAALGIKRIILLETWRVEKSYWMSPVLQSEILRQQLILGLEQSVDTMLPVVEMRRRFKPFAQDELPALSKGSSGFTAHPLAAAECPRNIEGHATLALGPEGGFTAYEVDLLWQAGLKPVTLGPRILRVETAVAAIIGRLW